MKIDINIEDMFKEPISPCLILLLYQLWGIKHYLGVKMAVIFWPCHTKICLFDEYLRLHALLHVSCDDP